MEKFNKTATLTDIYSVLEFANGVLNALTNKDGSATKKHKEDDERNFAHLIALACLCLVVMGMIWDSKLPKTKMR